MAKRFILAAGLAALVLGGIAQAAPGDRMRDKFRERMRDRQHAGQTESPARRGQTIAYGNDALQNLDFWRAIVAQPSDAVQAKAPLVIFVHGGGWSKGSKDNATGRYKADHYTRQGYAFASINYRLVPGATVEQQAADIATALKTLHDRADRLGVDRSRIVLMGHSAGAHLVALVGTDERYLRGVGLSFANVAGVIPIDGAAYDVPAQMVDGPKMMHDTYQQAFGSDPVRQRALSPTLHGAAPNAASFLIPHVQRADGIRQSEALAAALRSGGSEVQLASIPGGGLTGHMEINRKLGDPSYAATELVDRWLRGVFGW